MTQRERRPKASDLFRETDHIFGKTSDFSAAFPKTRTVDVTIDEWKFGGGAVRTTHLTQASVPEYVDCHNPECYGGGVNVGGLLREMESLGQTSGVYDKACRGHRGSPKGKVNYGPCGHFFKVTIEATYK